MPCAKQSSGHRQHKQCDADVAEKQEEAETVRLLAERNDLLTRVPCERKADCHIMTGKPRRDGCDYECGKDEDAPFKGIAHMSPNAMLTGREQPPATSLLKPS